MGLEWTNQTRMMAQSLALLRGFWQISEGHLNLKQFVLYDLGFPSGSSDKEPTCQCRLDNRVVGSVPGLGRSSGGGHW